MIEEISVKELDSIDREYQIIDIRDEISFQYGSISGAVNIPKNKIEASFDVLDKKMLYIIVCKSGIISDIVAEELRNKGYNAINLKEGYYGYMLQNMKADADKSKEVEKSINKKFHKVIWSKFVSAIKNYQLVEENDKIAVCISGGKDSMELIRPMYLIREDDIKHWRDYNDLHFIQCACKFTDTCTSCNPDNASKRQEIKNTIKQMKKTNPYVEGNIFSSVENVNLDTIIGYKKDGEKYSFLDSYKRNI